jgi:hypothetical protein
MALKDYQQEIDVDTLYSVAATGRGTEQVKPNIEVVGGTVDIYMAQNEPATPPTGMAIIEGGEGFVGNAAFDYVQNYLYIEQASGTTTSIILSGIDAVEVV